MRSSLSALPKAQMGADLASPGQKASSPGEQSLPGKSVSQFRPSIEIGLSEEPSRRPPIAGRTRPRHRRAIAVLLALASLAGAQGPSAAAGGPEAARDPLLFYQSDGVTLRGHFQAGVNWVSERNLFWNLSDRFAADEGFDPDANWLEGYIKPGLSASVRLGGDIDLFAKLSGAASFTLGTDAFDAADTGRVTLEEGHLGLRAGLPGGGQLEVSAGARELELGTGMLISNGSSDGFERGALKFGPRRAWEIAGLAVLSAKGVTATGFYLEPNEPKTNDSQTAMAGIDLRYDGGRAGAIGATYLNVLSSQAPYPQARIGSAPSVTPGDREGLNVIDLYAAAPSFGGALENAVFAGEVAYEWNGRIDLRAFGGRAQAGYRFADVPWSPVLSYSYQIFSGDDPKTARQERFDPLYYNGSPSAWATGSKSAMMFINSNVQSHNLSLRLSPTRQDTLTLRYAHVRAHELRSPLQFGQATRFEFDGSDLGTVIPGVTDAHLSDDLFLEFNRIVNRHTYLTAGVSLSVPGRGIRKVVPGNTPVWVGGFVNVVVDF